MSHHPKKVGLAFQGGGFPAGAIGTGVVKYLVENDAFKKNDFVAFSGTSAGALVASVCWGLTLTDKMQDAPAILEKQWLHNAWGTIPNATIAQLSKLANSLALYNPVYRLTSDHVKTPIIRYLFKEWVKTYIPFDDWKLKRDQATNVPGLALGAADILRGDIKVFTEHDFSLDAILASGSLDDINGLTTITSGDNAGTYCDGAWGTNPPLNVMIEKGIDELWLVEVFPKLREKIPSTSEERADRKDELWQNSLVEHELKMIAKVNEWIVNNQLNTTPKEYKKITIKKMPMTLDLPTGAALINSKRFILQMMNYGYMSAHQLWDPKPSPIRQAAYDSKVRQMNI